MISIYLLRHGQTDYNREMRIQGQVDIELNEAGKAQALRVAKDLAEVRFTQILTSPLGRAKETAEIIAAHREHPEPIVICEELTERAFGPWEGLNRKEIDERYPEESRLWHRGGTPNLPGIESRTQVGARVAGFLDAYAKELAARYRVEPHDTYRPQVDENLLVISHGAAISQGMITLLGLATESDLTRPSIFSGVNNCEWSVLGLSSGKWRLEAYNRNTKFA